jgi:hypothetical protein
MSQMRLPKIKDPLGDLNLPDLSILPEIVREEEQEEVEEEEIVTHKDVFGEKKNKKINPVKKDKIINDMPEPITKVGKRGKDKAKRKKKVMSQAQLDALARGRAKSLAKRKEKSAAKKQPVKQVIKEMKPKKSKPVNIPVMPKPTPHTKLDYDTFSSYMTQYDEARKKKQNTSSQPHPNKIINERHRPTPPQSLPNPLPKQKPVTWKGTSSVFAQYKKGNGGRWNYGI